MERKEKSVRNQSKKGSSHGREDADPKLLYNQYQALLDQSQVSVSFLGQLKKLPDLFKRSGRDTKAEETARDRGEQVAGDAVSAPAATGTEEQSKAGQSGEALGQVYGFDDQVSSLMKKLDNADSHQLKAVAVVGAMGVGKTALVKSFFDSAKVKADLYAPRIWVQVLDEYQLQQQEEDNNCNDHQKAAIAVSILASLGVPNERIEKINGLPSLLYALHRQLWGKKYLVVLDDVRDSTGWCRRLDAAVSYIEPWDTADLSLGFPKGYGGAVIVTTRSEDVAKKLVGEDNLLHLQPLIKAGDGEILWKIYEDSLRLRGKVPNFSRDSPEGQLLITKCGGLPLAAKLMAQLEETPVSVQGDEVNGVASQDSEEND